nr:hp [Calliteara abietis nucleopolyhedrovirus]
MNGNVSFRDDLAQLTRTIVQNKQVASDFHLGDVLAQMCVNKRLLTRLKEDNFDIVEGFELSNEARAYLNALQGEKLKHCRHCYHKNAHRRCEFHKKYIFEKNPNEHYSEYVSFLNSEMGVISFVELYYTYLCLDFWRATAVILFRDLTGFDNVKTLLTEHGYACADDVDVPCVDAMDIDDDDDDDNSGSQRANAISNHDNSFNELNNDYRNNGDSVGGNNIEQGNK